MKQFDPVSLLEKSESLGLGEHLRGSEIAYHFEAIEALLTNRQTVTKSATGDIQETDIDITVRMLQDKYGKK